jgi:hypothetical protein
MAGKHGSGKSEQHGSSGRSGSEKESTKHHVDIEQGIQIDPVKDFREEYRTNQLANTAHSNRQLFWTIVSVALLFVYVVLTAWQGCSAQKSLDVVKEQFRLDQRPYMSVVQLQIEDGDLTSSDPKQVQKFEIGKPLVVTVEFKNVGKSPAINTIYHYHILFGENLKDFKVEPTDKGKKGPTVDPGSNRFSTAVSLIDTYSRESAVFSPSDVVNWDGSPHVVLFGRVSYEDTSGHFYCTPLFGRIHPRKLGLQQLRDYRGCQAFCEGSVSGQRIIPSLPRRAAPTRDL